MLLVVVSIFPRRQLKSSMLAMARSYDVVACVAQRYSSAYASVAAHYASQAMQERVGAVAGRCVYI